ncbi:MAG: hypothetical protein JW863_06970 [Chitinispirillaceae bacterium]|nr:hypothetical protein [Chitinispirillaceae bacterium]
MHFRSNPLRTIHEKQLAEKESGSGGAVGPEAKGLLTAGHLSGSATLVDVCTGRKTKSEAITGSLKTAGLTVPY